MSHLLTYYVPHRCSAKDTQDLYLGFEEIKPLLSVLNKIQINIEKDEKLGFTLNDDRTHMVLQENNAVLISELMALLREDVVKDTKEKK
ncbi:conserved hypothetical protein [Vibrio phage 501E54-1]|nr:conserved hypothetical protein [Vibrio phage 501E54-1]